MPDVKIPNALILIAVLALAGALLVAGCGGGSSSFSSEATAKPREEQAEEGGAASEEESSPAEGGADNAEAGGSFLGRYRVKVLSGGSSGVRGGELTIFIQEEFPGSEELAGILKLRTKTNNDVVYLKELERRGRTHTATLKGGSFLGPTIGNFKGTMEKPGVLSGWVATRGLGTVKARFVRFSANPTP
jgi:hypothetical protein